MTDDTATPPAPSADLAKTLGFAAGDTVFVEATPSWYSALEQEVGFELTPDLPATHAHLFFSSKQELHEFLTEYNIKQAQQSVWFSWPKRASGMKTDLTDRTFRDTVPTSGWDVGRAVDLDDNWYGLQFVRIKK